MASNSEDSFHEAIKFSLEKLGKPDLELKREQFETIRAVCVERKDVLAVLPTGFGKSLISFKAEGTSKKKTLSL